MNTLKKRLYRSGSLTRAALYVSSAALGVMLLSGTPVSAATTTASSSPVSVQIMKHLCNNNVKNIQDFLALEQGRTPVAALANTVLNCPTTGLLSDAAATSTVASPRMAYDFQVYGNTSDSLVKTMSTNGMFMQHKVCESDIGVDVNTDGSVASSTCLDISHYEIGAMSDAGTVQVKESKFPEGFHFGTLRFTPPSLMANNDAASLREIDAANATIHLNVADDTDHVVMLHVYNFRNASSTTMGTTTGSVGTTTMTGMGMGTTTTQMMGSSTPMGMGTTTGMMGGSMGGSMMPPTTQPNFSGAMIDQNGTHIRAGSSIDFGGHGFGHEETVLVMSSNGSLITKAHADGGGNFSTGSLSGPTSPGVYTYRFVGQNTNMTVYATVTVGN